jgi:vitamin B12 transporter
MTAQGGHGQAALAVSLRHVASDGTLPFNNEYRNTTASGRLAVQLDETSVAFALRHTDAVFHFPTDGAGSLVDSNQFLANRMTSLSLDLERRIGPDTDVQITLGLNRTAGAGADDPDHPGDSLGVFASRSQSERQRRSVDARVNARPSGASILTLGAVVEDERESSLSQFQSSFGPFGGAVEASRWNAGLYGQGIIGWDKAHLQVGARYDRNERFGSFLTARAGVVVRPALATRIYAAVGNSFKEPTFIETFGGGFVVGNAALNPERSLSWEVGVEQWVTRNGMALAVTYFDQRFRDIVQYNAAPAQAGDPNYFNVAAATVRGVELEATWLVRPWARLQAHYAYLASEVTNAGFADGPNAEFVDGRRLLRRPTYTMGMMVHAHAGNVVSGVVSARYAGSRDDLDFSSFPFRRVTLPGRTLVDLGAEVRPTPWADIALTVRGENVFGVRYEEVRGFPARGRTVLIGVRIGN